VGEYGLESRGSVEGLWQAVMNMVVNLSIP
jgi:hypothetical protein